jgi:aldehyde:ferredoxin oxidoreductase
MNMKILRVDVKNEKITFENLPEEWRTIGGSALIAKIMHKEVPPTADPLGPENLFIAAVGPLAGTGAPQLGRISVGAKSPLTMGKGGKPGVRCTNSRPAWDSRDHCSRRTSGAPVILLIDLQK